MRLGADPETFLLNEQGKHISVIGLIGADKYNPLQVDGMPKGFTLQEDNVALEFGQPPSANEDEWVFNTKAAMQAGLSKLKGLSFSKLSCTVFDEDQMEHPMAHIFGCEPDYNAYTGKKNKKPVPHHSYMRSAGGHVHVELPKTFKKENKRAIIRAMDLYLGVPSILMDSGEDRRKLYGQAGAMRYKPYGVEYRTLSNFWIFEDKLIRWVWRNTERALSSDMLQDKLLEKDIQTCINSGDKNLAKMLIEDFKLEVV